MTVFTNIHFHGDSLRACYIIRVGHFYSLIGILFFPRFFDFLAPRDIFVFSLIFYPPLHRARTSKGKNVKTAVSFRGSGKGEISERRSIEQCFRAKSPRKRPETHHCGFRGCATPEAYFGDVQSSERANGGRERRIISLIHLVLSRNEEDAAEARRNSHRMESRRVKQ